MANIVDKFMDFMKLGYDEYDEEEELEPEEPMEFEEKKSGFFKKNTKNAEEKAAKSKNAKKEGKVSKDVPPKTEKQASVFNKNVSVIKGGKDLNMSSICTITPANKDESAKKDIGTKLLEGKTVLINLEGLDSDFAQRLVDFTAGVCFAINGDMKYPSKYFVLAVPEQVELTGTYVGEDGRKTEPTFNGMSFDKFQF